MILIEIQIFLNLRNLVFIKKIKKIRNIFFINI